MIPNDFQEFKKYVNSTEFRNVNSKLTSLVKNYEFLYNSKDFIFNFDRNQNAKKKLIKSKILIINSYIDQNIQERIFVFGFNKTIIISNHLTQQFIDQFFLYNPKLSILFLSETKTIFQKIIKLYSTEVIPNEFFDEEIKAFNDNFLFTKLNKKPFYNIANNIIPCITGYLIQIGYQNANKDKFSYLTQKPQKKLKKIKIFDENDFVELRQLGIGSSFKVSLIYYIEKEKLCVIKCGNTTNINEIQKRINRICNNCLNLKFPFLAKFYGKVKNKNCIIMEFVNGKTLNEIEKMTDKDIFYFIYELTLSIHYLHFNHLIMRDLKPDNIMIDKNNKRVFLVDFDSMIRYDEINSEEFTNDFTDWTPPEVNKGEISYKCDIYSLGKIILEFFVKNISNRNENIKKKLRKTINKNCLNSDPEKRISISNLFKNLWHNVVLSVDNYSYYITLAANQNDPNLQYELGLFFLCGKIYNNKAIHYLTLAANNGSIEAQIKLGIIYYKGKHVKEDINKTIHFFTLAANQGDSTSQTYLGIIYYNGEKGVLIDINKSIYYFKLAADQNDGQALHELGMIYYKNKYIKQDLNKALEYLTRAADQNYVKSQLELYYFYINKDANKAIYYLKKAAKQNNAEANSKLGLLYFDGKYIKKDINKAIYHLTKAAEQNNSEAQSMLGIIYFDDEYIKRDINKAFYYLTKAAEQNDAQAQYNLGLLYGSKGGSSFYDINKAVYYFILASNQNFEGAQSALGQLYMLGDLIPQDIHKSIYYYTLSANNNNVSSYYNLGVIYNIKIFGVFNINKAIYYFTIAANRNHIKAQYSLGQIYSNSKSIHVDIEKSIYYYKLAANQNDVKSQHNLGCIYYEGKLIKQDIQKAILYFTLAANQNNPHSSYNLYVIYIQGIYTTKYIEKSIYYLESAANQNLAEAQYHLGRYYYEGKYVKQNIEKGLYYLNLSANKNYLRSFVYLGFIYQSGLYTTKDINKAIYYYSIAANKNDPYAQYALGKIYINEKDNNQNIEKGINYLLQAANKNISEAQFILGMHYLKSQIKRNINDGVYWIIQSSKNGLVESYFTLGFLYHKGEYLERNINTAINYYKNASSFNKSYAKNNLGIIYKNGFNNEISRNVENAKIYFQEAIKNKKDSVSMYNLAHLYIYENECIDESIDLLFKSLGNGFLQSSDLLCLILIKKYQFNFGNIKNELKNYTNKTKDFMDNLEYFVKLNKLDNPCNFQAVFMKYSKIDFLYDIFLIPFPSFYLFTDNKIKQEPSNNNKRMDITSHFYEGFGYI